LLFALAFFNVARAQQFAVVASEFSGTVALIDTRTNTITTTIPTGSGSDVSPIPSSVAVTPDGRVAYVVRINSDTVSAIDLVRRTVGATVPVGVDPTGVAVAPNGARAYVTNACGAGPACSYPGTVSVIDTATNQVAGTIEVGSFPRGLAVTPDGKELYVANSGSGFGGDVWVITTDDNRVVATINGSFPGGPVDIAITPNGLFAYVTAVFSQGESLQGRIWVIDTRTRTVVATIELAYPEGIALTPDGTFAYVADAYNGDVLVVDTANNTVVTTIAVAGLGSGTTGVAITPNGAFVYVTSRYLDKVTVIDTSTNAIAQTIPVDGGPAGIAIAVVPMLAPTATPTATPTASPTARSACSDSGDGCAVAAQPSTGAAGGASVLLFALALYWVRRRIRTCFRFFFTSRSIS
jgi:YVTN family beta-propeller protein